MEVEGQIQRRFTLTIPKRIRQQLGLKEGFEIVWTVEDGKIVIYPKTVKTLKGIFKGSFKYGIKEKKAVELAFLQRRSDLS